MTDPLTEAVARAICRADGQDYNTLSGSYNGRERQRDLHRYAQAAIAAMREQLVPQWQPIETAPKGEAILGLRDPSATGRQPAFIGEVYDLRPGALLDVWSGRWAVCTHWMPLPAAPTDGEG